MTNPDTSFSRVERGETRSAPLGPPPPVVAPKPSPAQTAVEAELNPRIEKIAGRD